jgi:hypothetical protein
MQSSPAFRVFGDLVGAQLGVVEQRLAAACA